MKRLNPQNQKKLDCSYCGTGFVTCTYNHKYCSKKCKKDDYNKNNLTYSNSGLSTGKIGAVGELKVCIDLLSRGYEVFRSVSQACSCDLVILSDSKAHRVEVRTAVRNNMTGTISVSRPKPERYDILALVFNDTNEIIYQPNFS